MLNTKWQQPHCNLKPKTKPGLPWYQQVGTRSPTIFGMKSRCTKGFVFCLIKCHRNHWSLHSKKAFTPTSLLRGISTFWQKRNRMWRFRNWNSTWTFILRFTLFIHIYATRAQKYVFIKADWFINMCRFIYSKRWRFSKTFWKPGDPTCVKRSSFCRIMRCRMSQIPEHIRRSRRYLMYVDIKRAYDVLHRGWVGDVVGRFANQVRSVCGKATSKTCSTETVELFART